MTCPLVALHREVPFVSVTELVNRHYGLEHATGSLALGQCPIHRRPAAGPPLIPVAANPGATEGSADWFAVPETTSRTSRSHLNAPGHMASLQCSDST
jgi:hypothetical protein